MSQTKARKVSEATLTQFKKLLQAARKEHSKNGLRASADTPAHQAAIQFAQAKKIPGVESLLAALPAIWNEKANEEALAKIRIQEKEIPTLLMGITLYIQGLLMANLKKWDDAIECYQKALETPGYDLRGTVFNSLGNAYCNKKEYDLAIEFYQKALETPGYDSPGAALNNLGFVYRNKIEYDRAIECYQKALETPGYDTPGAALNNLGLVYRNKIEYDRAIECFQKALETPGNDRPGVTMNNLGIVYSEKGEHDRAIEFFQKALDTPGYDTPGMALNNLGVVYAEKSEHDRAIEFYQKALAIRYDSPHKASNNLANSFRKTGRLDKAQDVLDKILLEPDAEGEHARALDIKRLMEEAKAGVEPTVAEESLTKAGVANVDETHEQIMLNKLGRQEQGRKDKYDEYLVREVPARKDGFTCLRGWSSAVTLLEGGEECHWAGGGYFLRWLGKGIVIDPGFDFMDNFHDANLHLKEVDAVLVSHNHSDHNYDLSSLDDLRYELHRRWKFLKSAEERELHDVSRCLFVLDEDTSRAFRDTDAEHRGLPMKFSESDAQRKRWIERQNDLPVTIEHFKVEHGADVPHAMGMRLRLHDGESGKDFVFGYTGDTRWHPPLEDELRGCDVLLAHISMPSDEELLDDDEYEAKLGKPKGEGGFQGLPSDGFKHSHLGYRGMIELISRTQPKMVLVGEFWAGLADLRIDLVKGLRSQVKKRTGRDIPILPTGLGLRLRLPSLEVECTSCSKLVTHSELKIAPAANSFGPLSYLCPKCLG